MVRKYNDLKYSISGMSRNNFGLSFIARIFIRLYVTCFHPTFLVIVAQNSSSSMAIAKNEEIFMLFMFLKEKDKLPYAEAHFCDTWDVPPTKISILKLKALSRNVDFLQTKYTALNEKYNEFINIDVAESVRCLCQKLISLHQRRIEAATYMVIHMTTNLGRMAGGCNWLK